MITKQDAELALEHQRNVFIDHFEGDLDREIEKSYKYMNDVNFKYIQTIPNDCFSEILDILGKYKDFVFRINITPRHGNRSQQLEIKLCQTSKSLYAGGNTELVVSGNNQ